MALPVFTPGKKIEPVTTARKSGLPVFEHAKIVKVEPTIIANKPATNTYQDLVSKFGSQEISTPLKPGEFRISDTTKKFADQEISKPRVYEGPRLENKIGEAEFIMKELQAGRASYRVNPETGKREITSPEIETFRKLPDTGRAVMLDEQAKSAPLIKALESPLGKEITGQITEKTSDIPLKFWAGVKSVGSLGTKTYEDAKSELIKAKEDPNNPTWQKFLYQAQDSIPQTVIGVGLSMLPGGSYLSSGYFGALSVESERQKPGGLGASTAGNVVIDVVGDRVLGGILEKMLVMPAKALTSKILSTLKTAGSEGSTEVLQTLLKYSNDYKEANSDEEKQAILDQAKKYITSGDMAMEFTVGAVAGGGVGMVGSSVSGGPVEVQQQMKREPYIEEVKPTIIGEVPPAVAEAEANKPTKLPPFVPKQTTVTEDHILVEAKKYSSPEEFIKNNDFIFQGGKPGTESAFWSTKIGMANAYATQKGLGDGEIRIARFSDLPKEIRMGLTKNEYFKERGAVISLDKKLNPPILAKIERDVTGLKGDNQLAEIWKQAQETTQPLKKGPQSMPTGAPETQPAEKAYQSRVYDRLKKENPDKFKDDATYEAVKLKEDLDRAAELVATDKEKAYRIAMGMETSTDILSTSVSEIMFEKALDEGNLTMANTLLKNLSFRATRMGQEIVALKGGVSNNSTAQFVKELIDTRLAELGKKYLGDITDKATKDSNQKRGLKKIKKEVESVKEKISKKKELDLAEAQSIIDSLTCK